MIHTYSDHQQMPANNMYVIGIGASAGGIEALCQVMQGLPGNLNCCYIIAQHISPSHQSVLGDILARKTHITVQQIENGQSPSTGRIYIIPPGHHMEFVNGLFHLIAIDKRVSPSPSIDRLFNSIAHNFGNMAIGIILSGTGNDGMQGVSEIDAIGGKVIIQNPESAQYDGMPRAAISQLPNAQLAHPKELGKILTKFIQHEDSEDDSLAIENPDLFKELLELVEEKTQINFGNYKLPTVQRRLKRRIELTQSQNLTKYLQFAKNNPEELTQLAQETLISVTEFFRDSEAYNVLDKYIEDILKKKNENDELRIWVVGCASGEEAYTIAMICLEKIKSLSKSNALKIFATDIDENALSIARNGNYSVSSTEKIPEKLRKKYFIKVDNGYEAKKILRSSIVFARHDVSANPPITHLDLLTCRNVMIYFNEDLQKKVLSIFHSVLNPEGILFLGRAESTGADNGLYQTLDRSARIYKPQGQIKSLKCSKISKMSVKKRIVEKPNYQQIFYRAIDQFILPALLVDDKLRLLHGGIEATTFMTSAIVNPMSCILGSLASPFGEEILLLLNRAKNRKKSAYGRKHSLNFKNKKNWRMGVHPVKEGTETLYLLTFHHGCAATTTDQPEELDVCKSHGEKKYTKEALQALSNEINNANEEMQALSEEFQATNEELQASNEELEATNEELQATNQELINSNHENIRKAADLTELTAEYDNLYNSLDMPIMVFDSSLHLKRINSAAMLQYDISAHNIGKEYQSIKLPSHLKSLDEKMYQVIHDQEKQTIQVQHEERHYQIRLSCAISKNTYPQSVILYVVDNTETITAKKATAEINVQLEAIMENSTSLICLKDTAGRYQYFNKKYQSILGVELSKAKGKTDLQLIDETAAKSLREHDLQVMRDLTAIESIDEIHLDTGSFWLKSNRFPIFDRDGTISSICTQSSDITNNYHQSNHKEILNRDGAIENVVTLLFNSDRKITGASRNADLIFKKEPLLLYDLNLDALISPLSNNTSIVKIFDECLDKGRWNGELTIPRQNESGNSFFAVMRTMYDHTGTDVIYSLTLSQQNHMDSMKAHFEYMNTHDPLTKLLNRTYFLERLDEMILRAKRLHRMLAVIFLDLDNFKQVNDGFGHNVGDKLLIEVTARIRSCVRQYDIIARWGGDEFTILLAECEMDDITTMTSRINSKLAEIFMVDDKTFHISASLGVSIYPTDADNPQTLIKHADSAMYHAKKNGRNQCQFYSYEMKALIEHHIMIEAELYQAIEHKLFYLQYQPQISLSKKTICGAEALIRLQSPKFGGMLPGEFIPIAESSDLIIKIGDLILRQVFSDIDNWIANNLNVVEIAVNISAKQLIDPGFLLLLHELSDSYPQAKGKIKLEITENVLLCDTTDLKSLLSEIVDLGFSLSIDDFGTGYCSLSYLELLPLSEIKIDKRFINHLENKATDKTITSTIICMSHALGMKAVAEGVENEEQLRILNDLSCDVIQGFIYHKPLLEYEYAQLLKPLQ